MTTSHMALDNPETVPAPYADRFSNVARVDLGGGSLLFLSGQTGIGPDGKVIGPGDVTAQAEVVFDVIGKLLAAHGATFSDILHLRTFMTNMDDLRDYGAVRRKYFGDKPPASTTVESSRLFLDGLVIEVEVTAAVPAGRRPASEVDSATSSR